MTKITIVILCIVITLFIVSLAIFLIVKSKRNHEVKTISEKRGVQGEKSANYHLKRLIKSDEYLLTNVLLPLRNKTTTEIDSIMITRKGIFCMEIKNWIGHIKGDDNSEYWIQVYDDPSLKDKKHRNPVKQNENHCRVLKEKLNYVLPIKNIVLFTQLEDKSYIYSSSTFDLYSFDRYYRKLSDKLSINDVKKVYKQLCYFQASDSELKKHTDKLKKTYGNN